MSVLIKGMEMPTSCAECGISHKTKSGVRCLIASKRNHFSCTTSVGAIILPFYCPLVPVPPHGRLIEENKVLDIVSEWCPDDDGSVGKVGDLREMLDEIEALPTVIPAEEGE